MLLPGDPAPHFRAMTPSNPTYNFGTVAGRYIVLALMPSEGGVAAHERLLAAVAARRGLFDDDKVCFFGVTRHPDVIARVADEPPGVRWFQDVDGEVFRQLGGLGPDGQERPQWLVLDPMLRGLMSAPFEEMDRVLAWIAGLPPVDRHAGVPVHAPVLIVPRVFEPAFCKQLIDLYETGGAEPSGFMREVDGKTVLMRDENHKRRSDVTIESDQIQLAARARMVRRLSPEITRAFNFTPTRIERFIVACYDAAEQGFFRAHRDNTTKGTAHRKFAVTINLNTGDYDGGDLRFPEFGTRTYRAPLGGAVVFSCSLLHEATPVTRGTRYAFLPFLYDEDGARIREANAGFLAEGSSYKSGLEPSNAEAEAEAAAEEAATV